MGLNVQTPHPPHDFGALLDGLYGASVAFWIRLDHDSFSVEEMITSLVPFFSADLFSSLRFCFSAFFFFLANSF